MNERPDFPVHFRGEVLRDGVEGGVGPGIGGAVPADEPVGNVDVVPAVFGGAVPDEEVGDGDVERSFALLRMTRGGFQFRGLPAPGVVAINVREGGDGTALQHVEPGIELGLPAGGEPDELGDEPGADDGGLLGLHQGNRLLGEERQQVFAEEALRQRPFLRELAGVFEEGVHPGDFVGRVLVLDAVAGLGVVFHDFAGADAALDVNLVEDDGTVAGDSDAVFVDEAFEDDGVEEGGEEAGEVGGEVWAEGLGDDVFGEGVHFVHRVHYVYPFLRGGRFGLLDDLGDHGLAEADFLGDFPVGFALLEELDDVLYAVQGLGLFLLAEVLALGGVFLEFEVGEAAGLLDLVDDDVVGVVAEGSGADLELLDVAEALVLGGFADGEDGVKEVVELLASGEVVLGDGAGERALGRVGDDEDGPAVLFLELHEFHHGEAGIDAFVGAVAEVGEVVDDDDVAVQLEGGGFDVLEDAVFVVFEVQVHVVDLGPVHAARELVEGTGGVVGVAELGLLFGELAVEVEDAVPAGDLLGDLHGVDGFPEVGVGEEAGDFSLVPEFEEERDRVGHLGGIGEGVVDFLDGEHADGAGVCVSFHCSGDGFNGVQAMRCFHLCGS